MAITTIADLTSIIQTIVAETQYTARHAPVMRQLCWTINMPEHKGHPVDVPKLGTLIAASLVEKVDLASPQTVTDTAITVTPAEVGLQCILTDRMISRAPSNFFKLVGEECGRAYAQKLDKDLLALLDGFSTSLVGTGSTPAIGHLSAARAQIKGNATEPGPDPVYAVLHPYQMKDIVDDLAPPAGGLFPAGISEEVLRNYIGKTKLFGMELFEDGNITLTEVTTGVYDAKGGVFSKKAIILIVTQEAKDFPQRDESLRATELNLIGEYGYAEYQDAWGVEIYSDATAPTA